MSVGRDLRCVFFDFVDHSDDFFFTIVAAGGANVVRTLQLATARTFVRVCSNQRIVRTTIVATRLGYFVLLDSHVSTFVFRAYRADPEADFVVRFKRCDVRLGRGPSDVQP